MASITCMASKMTRQAVEWSHALLVTVHAEPHRHVDVPLGHALLTDVAVARRARDLGADVRGVVEPDVRRRRVVEHPPPGEVSAVLAHLGDLADARSIRGDCPVTRHARSDARKAGNRTLGDALVAVLRARNLTAHVDVVRELERLLDDVRAPAEKIVERGGQRRTSGREHVRRLPRQELARGGPGYVGLEQSATDAGGQRQRRDETRAGKQRGIFLENFIKRLDKNG